MTNFDQLHETPQRPAYPTREREGSPWGKILVAAAVIAFVFFGLAMFGASVDEPGLSDAGTGAVTTPAPITEEAPVSTQ
ncbi:MAG: hypothetical protein AAFO70_09600 [Pseudomonadota bacterium]